MGEFSNSGSELAITVDEKEGEIEEGVAALAAAAAAAAAAETTGVI